jgi:hypothetical protein
MRRQEIRRQPTTKSKIDMRGKNNKIISQRRQLDHIGALVGIYRDYLGPIPLFGEEFAAPVQAV